jgi:hypothetical protein
MENDYQNFNTPEKKEAYINKVFQAHKATQAQWDTSLSWYSDRIDLYLKMNDSVKARCSVPGKKLMLWWHNRIRGSRSIPHYCHPLTCLLFIYSRCLMQKEDSGSAWIPQKFLPKLSEKIFCLLSVQ